MTENTMMMMGRRLNLQQLSKNGSGLNSSFRWYGKVLGMTIDFREVVTKWQPPSLKEWETVGEAKIILCHGIRCGLKSSLMVDIH